VTLGAGIDTISTTTGANTTNAATGTGVFLNAGDTFALTAEAVVTDFAAGAGGDRIDVANPTTFVAGGIASTAAVTTQSYIIAGTYTRATNTFVAGANDSTGNDTLW